MFARGACFVLAAVVAAQDPVVFGDDAARGLFDRARAAIVHTGKIADLRTLVLRGRVRFADRELDRDGDVEIKILLPDHFLRVDRVEGTIRRSGFAGRTLLSDGGDLSSERARFARLMLGAALYAAPDEKLAVRSTGEDPFPNTQAVDLKGPSFAGRLVFDASSLVPLRILYFGDRGVSTIVSFADRRRAGGLEFPFRVATQTNERVLETLMFDDVLVNPPLDKGEFVR